MPFALKLALSTAIVALCAAVGRRFPTLGGLIATMPLTSLLVLVWLYSDEPANRPLLIEYTRGACGESSLRSSSSSRFSCRCGRGFRSRGSWESASPHGLPAQPCTSTSSGDR
jgi:hypothetical protein